MCIYVHRSLIEEYNCIMYVSIKPQHDVVTYSSTGFGKSRSLICKGYYFAVIRLERVVHHGAELWAWELVQSPRESWGRVSSAATGPLRDDVYPFPVSYATCYPSTIHSANIISRETRICFFEKKKKGIGRKSSCVKLYYNSSRCIQEEKKDAKLLCVIPKSLINLANETRRVEVSWPWN